MVSMSISSHRYTFKAIIIFSFVWIKAWEKVEVTKMKVIILLKHEDKINYQNSISKNLNNVINMYRC
jgi:hypothetical protein